MITTTILMQSIRRCQVELQEHVVMIAFTCNYNGRYHGWFMTILSCLLISDAL